MFDDEKIERGEFISPALIQAIKESRIYIIVLSKQYASSSWCLDELLEIMECKEVSGQTVLTVFYEVEPSDVGNQRGEFGDAFKDTCAKNTKEHGEKWRKALKEVSKIAGEDFKNWKNEAEMIGKVASNILDILRATTPKDSDDMVGFEAHMREMESRLEFDKDVVKIVAICGPAGIGKTTIAKELQSRHSKKFHNNCFLNLRKSDDNCYDEYALREQLLSNVLNLNGIGECHSGLIQQRLHDQKVLIILDDVQSPKQLDVLAHIRWYGPGSRIIVTTENTKILQQHGINDIYHVRFPSAEEALMIFCLSAFRQTSPPDGFQILAKEVVRICGNLPLGLQVLGSSLRGKNLEDWILELPRLKDFLDKGIENVLEVGYKSLDDKDKLIFLCIAVFFNGERTSYVISMMDTDWNAILGLKNLADRNLTQHVGDKVEMHHLLQVMAMKVISKQDFPKQQILVNPREICNVLQKAKGNDSVVGISFDIAGVNKLKINREAFEDMYNLLFLKVYDGSWNFADFQSPELVHDYVFLDGYVGDKNAFDPKQQKGLMRDLSFLKGYNGMHIRKRDLHIPEEMEFPTCLRFVHWEYYPRKNLPLGFCTENLVKLDLKYSLLEKLWEGTQPLANLKEMNVNCSTRLTELPDLSQATNLEILNMFGCSSLVEIPSSVGNLQTLKQLKMDYCKSLEIIPTLANLTSLEGHININECSKLRTFPDFPTNQSSLYLKNTGVEELPASLRHCTRLSSLQMSGSGNLRIFSTHLPLSIDRLDLSNSGIMSITDCIRCLPNLQYLNLSGCKRLLSLPELPSSLHFLRAKDCESLKRVSVPLNTPNANLHFTNCFKLDSQAQRAIIQQSYFLVRDWVHNGMTGWGILPGREVPEEFVHQTSRNTLTIPPSTFNRVKGCIVISPKLLEDIFSWRGDRLDHIYFDCRINGNSVRSIRIYHKDTIQAEHLIIFCSDFLSFDPSKVSTEIVLECRVPLDVDDDQDDDDDEIIELAKQNEALSLFIRYVKFFYRKEKCLVYPLDIIEWGIQILTDNNDGSNIGSSNDNMDTLECGEVSGKEDDEVGSKSESGEASKDKDECIADTDESVLRKQLREKTVTSADTTLKRESKDDVFLQEKWTTLLCFASFSLAMFLANRYR